jgi:ketosteroid isomerase-like protein
MGSDEGAQAPESAPQVQHQRGQAPASWVARAASALVGAAVSSAAWEVSTTLRLALLVTGLAGRASAGLAGRAGQALGSPVGVGRELPEEVNRALVLRLYRAAVQADLATVRKLVAEDVAWWVPRPEPVAGQYHGITAAAPALGSVWRRIGRVQAVELGDVVASPERAAALVRLSVVRDGRPVALDWWVIFRIDGGQVTQGWGPFTVAPDGAEPSSSQAQPDGIRARRQER